MEKLILVFKDNKLQSVWDFNSSKEHYKSLFKHDFDDEEFIDFLNFKNTYLKFKMTTDKDQIAIAKKKCKVKEFKND